MELRVTPIARCLDKKLLILGFEIPDLLAIFFVLAILNFVFGSSGNAFILVWLPTAILALVLRLGKKGKPENYILHLLRFQLSPGAFTAFQDASKNLEITRNGRHRFERRTS